MSQNNINHIWFDFSETLVSLKKEKHDLLRYKTYAKVTGRPVDADLIAEYEEKYRESNHSNAAIFHSLGQPVGFWSDCVNSVDPRELYELTDKDIPSLLMEIRKIVPISIFSNIKLEKVLGFFGIDIKIFSHVISSGMVANPKPALDGFYKMVELSNLPAEQILYIGDDVGKDIRPAKQVGIKAGLMWKELAEADYSFVNFSDILKIIGV